MLRSMRRVDALDGEDANAASVPTLTSRSSAVSVTRVSGPTASGGAAAGTAVATGAGSVSAVATGPGSVTAVATGLLCVRVRTAGLARFAATPLTGVFSTETGLLTRRRGCSVVGRLVWAM